MLIVVAFVARVAYVCKEGEGYTTHKRLTLTIDEEVYEGLRRVVGPGKISQFVENLVRPHVFKQEPYDGYRAMGADSVREAEALEWTESSFGELSDEEG